MSIITCIQNVGFIGLFLSVCISCDLGISGQTEVTQQNVTLEVGTRSILPCHIQRRSYSVEWRRQRTSESEPLVSLDAVFGTRKGPGYEAELFNITEDYSLVINDVKVQDEGQYLCKIFDYETGKPILNWTQVSVQALPDEPFPIIRECMMKDVHPGACILKVNSTSKLTCLVKGYYPHIELYFLHGSEKVVSTLYEKWNNSDGTKNTKITILISVSDEPYKCVASGLPGIDGNRTVTVFAQANDPPQGFNTEKKVKIFSTVVLFMLAAGACSFIVFKLFRRNGRVRCSRRGFSRAPTDDHDMRTTPSKPVKFMKLFMDPVHGSMVFEDQLLIKIIDTPQFQRLRNIKQLGGCYYVYPGAAHNRFEHSLGVCYLAGEFIRTLHHNQPELNISDTDIRRVKIAGLCHDLGHGPFSHAFDDHFIPRRSREHPEIQEDLKHEDLSEMMFDHLIQQNNLKNKDLNDNDITEIKRMIRGVKDDKNNVNAEKRFLYQIVANKQTGIDVDKWDYFARDCRQLGMINNFDHKRCMEFARVIQLDSGRQICFRDKEAETLYQMFHNRFMLYRNVYNHRVSSVIQLMIMDACEEAEEATGCRGEKCFKIFPAKDGSKLTVTETLIKQDMHAYTYITDSIVERILSTTERELEKAREILENVQKRDKTKMYRLVHEVKIPTEPAEQFRKKLETRDIEDAIVGANADLKDDIIIKKVTIDYGQKDNNPINNVYFYSKSDSEKAFKLKEDDICFTLPTAFQEISIRLFCKKPDDQRNAYLKEAFMNWYESQINSLKPVAWNKDRGQETPARKKADTSSTSDREEQKNGETGPTNRRQKKLIMDPVHKSMMFEDELLIKIIDTPQFQRLRNIKQLGGCYYVYPGAAHNRFEHSLGVCHLAGRFIRTLRLNQPELNITDKDIRRVEIAGLCHDLGHGPLSRVFDKVFIPRRSIKHPEIQEGLKNEDLSVMMFDHLIQANNLKSEDLNDSDITEIKRMMKGVKDDDDDVAAEKRFLYQIVTNKSTGIDVDKFDYFARDCRQLGITNGFDYKRCMEFTRVIRLDNGRRILSFRDKEADNLYKMFHVRYMLHRRVYQHKASTAIEHMIMDAFEKADEATDAHGEKCFKIFPAKDGSKLTMTETLIKQDMYAYTYMTDSIVDRILSTTEKELEEARDILESVQKRDKTKLYRFVHKVLIPSEQADDFVNKWKTSDIVDGIGETNAGLKKSLIVKIVTINYGQKDKDPINNVHFYSKSDGDKAANRQDKDISLILPKAFQETYIRIYCKKPDDQLKSDIKANFENWYERAIGSTNDAPERERGQEGFGNLVDHTSLNSRQIEEIGMGEGAPGHDDVRMTRSKHAKFKKVFMDPIHASMVFEDELLIKIIDTPQFQRLRRIKQLGGCYYVYPGGAHNRFEHSLGVCHLAGEFIRTLHLNQPELNITPKDIRRVEIAGLCHDLGYGPLSHVFEKDFIPRRARKHPERQELKGLKHEDLSAMMFDHLIQQNNLKSEDFNDSDITEIKRMMKGVKDDGDNVPAEKGFLYQIVANKPTGIDVDKWDYFARDCHHLGIPNSFDHKRCMEFAKVIQQSSGRQILCFRDEEADNLYQMFYVRYMLHRRVYQHRVSSIIEHMIMDAFKEAEDARDISGAECFKIFPSKDGSKLTMTETLEKKDMHAYTYMTDSIQERILSTTEKGLEKARGILENVQKRDKTNMYRFVHEVLIPSEYGEDFLKKWKEELKIVDDIVQTSAGLEDYLIIKVVKINYGQKGKNPINNVHFYSKSDQDKAVTLTDEEISLILPKAFQEIFVRVYCKKRDAQRNADVKAAFEKWYKSEIDSLKRLKQDALKRERGQKTPERRNVGTSSTRDREEQRPSTEPSGKSVQRNLFGDSSDNKGRGNDEQECKQTLLTDMV